MLLRAARAQQGQRVLLEDVSEHSGVEGVEAARTLATEGERIPPLPERDWNALRQDLENETKDDLRFAVSLFPLLAMQDARAVC